MYVAFFIYGLWATMAQTRMEWENAEESRPKSNLEGIIPTLT